MNMRDSIYTQHGQDKDKHGKRYGYENQPEPMPTFEKALVAFIVGCVVFIVLISFSWTLG